MQKVLRGIPKPWGLIVVALLFVGWLFLRSHGVVSGAETEGVKPIQMKVLEMKKGSPPPTILIFLFQDGRKIGPITVPSRFVINNVDSITVEKWVNAKNEKTFDLYPRIAIHDLRPASAPGPR